VPDRFGRSYRGPVRTPVPVVRWERDAGRGRASWVFLSELGRELRGEVEVLWRHAEDELTAALTASERTGHRDHRNVARVDRFTRRGSARPAAR
jgi:DNA-binding MarR family transcriptional regulator